jgi:hypothetical protein
MQILRIAPLLHGGILPVFQPAIIICNTNSVVDIGYRMFSRFGSCRNEIFLPEAGEQSGSDKQYKRKQDLALTGKLHEVIQSYRRGSEPIVTPRNGRKRKPRHGGRGLYVQHRTGFSDDGSSFSRISLSSSSPIFSSLPSLPVCGRLSWLPSSAPGFPRSSSPLF